MTNIATDILIGVAVGDALGVPFEFFSRKDMKKKPAKDMVGYGTHNQPPGTWSDDSSLTFCLADSIINGYSLESIAGNFIKWKNQSYWTARNNVFDIGMTTAKAISRLDEIISNNNIDKLQKLKESAEEYDNGNGSLMRILPLIFVVHGLELIEQFRIIWDNSALTHRHIRAAMSCMIYLKLAEYLINGIDKQEVYQLTREKIKDLWKKIDFPISEQEHFNRIIINDINKLKKKDILSGGYVIESLEASFWCFLKCKSFQETVLTAINFGHDTDTTGAITGGIAGIYYKTENIPDFWISSLARMEDIYELGNRLNENYNP